MNDRYSAWRRNKIIKVIIENWYSCCLLHLRQTLSGFQLSLKHNISFQVQGKELSIHEVRHIHTVCMYCYIIAHTPSDLDLRSCQPFRLEPRWFFTISSHVNALDSPSSSKMCEISCIDKWCTKKMICSQPSP